MIRKSLVIVALFVSACTAKGPTLEEQRIAQLEQEKAQLQSDLKQARDNLAAMQRVIERGTSGSAESASDDGPAGEGVPAQPDNILDSGEAKPAG